MPIDRWMDKEDVVCICNGIFLNHNKEQTWVICSEVDEPTACYTEWSKSEKEKYIKAHMWNLGKWYWWTYLQGRNGDIDIENRLVNTAGEGEGGINWESSMDIYTLPRVKQTASGKLLHNRETNLVLCDSPEGWDRAWVGGRLKREGIYVCL